MFSCRVEQNRAGVERRAQQLEQERGAGEGKNLPDCWDRNQFEYFTETYPFLVVQNKKKW